MKPRTRAELGAIDIAEQAFHLIRRGGGSVIAPYAIGSLPFALALVYFCTDMTFNVFGEDRLPAFALVLALLFVWMKTWHTLYALRLRTLLLDEPAPPMTPARVVRILYKQMVVQSAGLVALPLAIIALVPAPFAYAFFQNFTFHGDAREESIRTAALRSARHAAMWTRQNIVIMWLLSPLLLLITGGLTFVMSPVLEAVSPDSSGGDFLRGIVWIANFIVYLLCIPLCPLGSIAVLNLGTLLFFLPELARIILGIEFITFKAIGASDQTLQMLVIALTYLCLDPIAKAAYVLRCHYSESLETGDDLRAQWRAVVARTGRTAAALSVLACAAWCSEPAWAQSAAPDVAQSVSPEELRDRIEDVLRRPEFAWRAPREDKESIEDEGPLMSFLSGVMQSIGQGITWMGERIDGILKWLSEKFRRDQNSEGGGWSGFNVNPQYLSIGLLLIGGLLLAYLLFRVWRSRPPTFREAEDLGLPQVPDIELEDIVATDYPEDTWLSMARDLLEKGQYRAALRATFLASLSVLGTQGFVQIAKFKSNREYQRELLRRAHAVPELPSVFGDGVKMFEPVWYGAVHAEREMVKLATAQYERIRAIARPQ